MNILDMPSDHMNVIRDKVKSFVHTGLQLTPDDTVAFVQRLNTVSAMIKEVEEENMVLNHALSARQDNLRNRRQDADVSEIREDNVVTLDRKPLARFRPNFDEGGAA